MPADVDADASVDLTKASDAELIARASEGDARALEVLYDRYARVVYSFALRIVGDPSLAEELLQEVFFRAWQQGGAFRASRGSFITWLLSITHNLAIDELRKRRRRPQRAENNTNEDTEQLLPEMPDESQDVEEEVWLASLRDRIADALASLPPAQREAIELAYFQGLTQREIAERLGEPLGTIKTRMRLGMQKLREQLSHELDALIERNEGEVDERE
ncbi:MAG: DNA-directed RNA polymerase sigma-70 factor [Thermomicrobiales bacterium]|nr:MAG: DNA-directed RNA polymerase sigma-70 factor [Thermomicrobiales bacterium]